MKKSVVKKADSGVSKHTNGSVTGARWRKNETIYKQDVFCGIEDYMRDIECLFKLPFTEPNKIRGLDLESSRGILLCGPSGCGKTLFIYTIAKMCGVDIIHVSVLELMSENMGVVERILKTLFMDVVSSAPCILFLDDGDVLLPENEKNTFGNEHGFLTQLAVCMDELSYAAGLFIIVVMAIKDAREMWEPLKKPGRFDSVIYMKIPSENSRRQILSSFTKNIPMKSVCLDWVARNTPGYTCADLKLLVKEVVFCAMYRNIDKSPEFCVEVQDFVYSLKKLLPSGRVDGLDVPNIGWNDIGALNEVIEELRLSMVEPIIHPFLFRSVGIIQPSSILIWGPPGCGKTLLAKAIANETHTNFISVKGPELISKYVGDSERAIRNVFERARSVVPCIIFFDELDSICPTRTGSMDSHHTARVVNQLLTEMDGLTEKHHIYVIGATNRPDIIDPAVLRPGRFDKLVYVGLPNKDERHDILRKHVKNTPLDKDVDLKAIAEDPRMDGLSGADICALVREASLFSIKNILPGIQGYEYMDNNQKTINVSMECFDNALNRVVPSISKRDRTKYDKLFRKLNLHYNEKV